jgi:hypothetical protein
MVFLVAFIAVVSCCIFNLNVEAQSGAGQGSGNEGNGIRNEIPVPQGGVESGNEGNGLGNGGGDGNIAGEGKEPCVHEILGESDRQDGPPKHAHLIGRKIPKPVGSEQEWQDSNHLAPEAGGALIDDNTQGPILYKGGPVMKVPNIPIYYIFYGKWTGVDVPTEILSGPAVLENFGQDLKSSPWLAINSQGYGAVNSAGWVGPSIFQIQSTTYGGTTTAPMTQTTIVRLVADIISQGRLPIKADAMYFVLTAPEIAVQNFCTAMCGWHSWASMRPAGSSITTIIKYGFIGSARRCMTGCSGVGNWPVSPNNNPNADAMASILAHEIAEVLTDPQLNAWKDKRGAENADKCAWNYGDVYVDTITSSTTHDSYYNVVLGSSQRKYMIQRNWVYQSSTIQGCGLSINGGFPFPPPPTPTP